MYEFVHRFGLRAFVARQGAYLSLSTYWRRAVLQDQRKRLYLGDRAQPDVFVTPVEVSPTGQCLREPSRRPARCSGVLGRCRYVRGRPLRHCT